MGEVVEILTLAGVWHDPRIRGHVGNGIVAGKEFAVREPLIQHRVQPVGLLDVALDRVGNFFWRVLKEVMVLAGHWSETAHLPEQPLERLDPAIQLGGDELSGLLSEIEQNRTRLEHRYRWVATGGVMVDDRRYPVIGRDLEKRGLKLLSLADVDRFDGVGHVGFFQEDRNLMPVRCRPIIKINHLRFLSLSTSTRLDFTAP